MAIPAEGGKRCPGCGAYIGTPHDPDCSAASQGRVKGQLHHIERDIGGNLGLAWMAESRDWPLFFRWIKAWSDVRHA